MSEKAPWITYRPELKVLDCTIRDGGLVNNHLFTDEFVIDVREFTGLKGQSFDVIINGTSLGLKGEVAPVPEGVLNEGAIAYDMTYGDGSKPFQDWALSQGATLAMDGLGMLVYQGAIGFKMWTGRDAPVAVMHQALAEVFGQ